MNIVNFDYNDSLDLTNHTKNIMYDGMSIKGNLYLSKTNFKKIPENVVLKSTNFFTGLVFAMDSQLEHVPETLSAFGIFAKNTNIKYLPLGLKLKVLSITDSPLKNVPEQKYYYELKISNTDVEELPDEIETLWNIDITNVPLVNFPRKLTANNIILSKKYIRENINENLDIVKNNGNFYIYNHNTKEFVCHLNCNNIIYNDNIKYINS